MSKDSIFRKLHYLFGVLAICVVIIIVLQNSEVVTVNFLIWKFELSRIALIFLMLISGFLWGYIVRGLRKQ